MSQEETNLATHVEICSIRYQQIQAKFDKVEQRLDKMESDISNLKSQMQTGFNDIKLLLEQRNTSRQTQILASAATIIVALIGAIGYYLTRH